MFRPAWLVIFRESSMTYAANHLLKCSHVIKLLLCLKFLESKLYLNTVFRNFAKAPKNAAWYVISVSMFNTAIIWCHVGQGNCAREAWKNWGESGLGTFQYIFPEFVRSDWMEVIQSPVNVIGVTVETATSVMHVRSVIARGEDLGV